MAEVELVDLGVTLHNRVPSRVQTVIAHKPPDNGEEYIKKSEAQQVTLSDRVIYRCRNAGVHVGTLVSRDGDFIVIKNANRVWKWSAAFTLSEIAMNGLCRETSRIAIMVPEMVLTTSDVCEQISVADGINLTECNNE